MLHHPSDPKTLADLLMDGRSLFCDTCNISQPVTSMACRFVRMMTPEEEDPVIFQVLNITIVVVFIFEPWRTEVF